MVTIKYVRSYKEAYKRITRATKAAEKRFMKEGRHLNKNSKEAKDIAIESKKYWKNNIYATFRERKSNGLQVTNQLGNSLVIEFNKNAVKWYMKRIGHPKGVTGGGECYDYGRLLRQKHTNEPQETSPWRYSWVRDYKVKNPSGQKALSYETYWGRWEVEWDAAYTKICDKYMTKFFTRIVDEELVKNL